MKMKTITGAVIACLTATGAIAQANLTAETAAPVTVPGITVLALGELAQGAGIADIQVATGQTLTNSVQNVAEGKTDIAAAPFLLPFLMSRGAGPYAALGPEKGAELVENLAVLYTYRFGTYVLTSFESNGFDGWNSVEGATIYNGPPRGAALNRARALTNLTVGLEDGKGYTGIQVNWGQAVKTMTDGSADGFILPTNFPDGRLAQASASGKMIAFSMPKAAYESEATQKYLNAPGTAGVELPIEEGMFGANVTVQSEDGNFRGIAEVGGEIVSASMDEELAYQLTKVFVDELESVKAKAPLMEASWVGETDQGITGLCGPMPIKYHPGAVRAWEEAGYTLPDCAK